MKEVTKIITETQYECENCNTQHYNENRIGKCDFCEKEMCDNCGYFTLNIPITALNLLPESDVYLHEISDLDVIDYLETEKHSTYTYYKINICKECYRKIRKQESKIAKQIERKNKKVIKDIQNKIKIFCKDLREASKEYNFNIKEALKECIEIE